MLLKAVFLGNPDCGIGTRAFLPFLALMRRLLERFQLALLVSADAFDCFQQSRSERMSIGIMPFVSYCTGLATGEGTYAAHEPLAQPP